MTTDIEYAAKAAGLVRHSSTFADTFLVKKTREDASTYGVEWNPLTDNGDSFRLMVKLRIRISWLVDASAVSADIFKGTLLCAKYVDFDPTIEGDDLRAVREAVFLVATEVGRKMT